ncbi:TonB-dependent receptor [Sphingobium sp. 15-1]|uniref:TonB-dependent receptor n=1 Tax=Sphingobium sp. 15-1 TaxID=2729616 RepID=UPI00159CBF76|nr:TonB-dependent receptor [Sphingobium sp. 15-1]
MKGTAMLRRGLAVFLLTTATGAWAQDASANRAAVPEAENEGGVPDIIVTAQKREERLQKVGISVSAFTGETLAKAGVASITDLTKIVPGLTATPSPTNTPVFTLRGIGFFESSVSSSPNVAVYLDQAPLSLPVYAAQTAFDLERVEVLKGPQGTLFGSNATGGAINFVAAKPSDTFHAGVKLGYGRFNTVDVDAFVTGPLSDTLNARLAVKSSKSDDWQKSYTRADTIGKKDVTAARLLFDWRPADRLRFQLDVNGWLDRSDPTTPQLARAVTPDDLSARLGTCSVLGCVTLDNPLLLYPAAPNNPRAADWPSDPRYRPKQDNGLYQAILNATYDVTDNIALTSLSNYIHYTQHRTSSLSGLNLLDVENAADEATAHDFTQELRLANTDNGPVRWVVGANLALSKSSQEVLLVYPDASTGCCQNGFTANTYTSDQKKRYIAGFANAQYDVTSQITLKAGIRYTDSHHTAVSSEYGPRNYAENPQLVGFEEFANFLFTTYYVPSPGLCPAGTVFQPIPPGGGIAIDPVTCQSGVYRGTLNEHNVSWSLGADFKPTQNVLLYANVAKGYKAGAFPATSTVTWTAFYPVKQESVLDYEAGFKLTLPGGRAIINGAGFYYDYSNKQLRGKFVDLFFGPLDQLIGIPKSTIKGAEIDATVSPIQNLTLRAAATYLDAKIKTYQGVVGETVVNGLHFPVNASFAGVRLPFSPSWQGSFSADYSFGINDRMDAFLGASVMGQTKSYGSPQLSAAGRADAFIPSYALLDLRGGLRSADGRWELTLWGKNVTNKFYWTNQLRNFDTIARYAGRPAEYGVTIGWKM